MTPQTNTPYFNSAFSLKEILTNMAISKLEAENVIREENLKNGSKKFMQDLIRKIESVERDMRALVGAELAQEIRKSMSGNDDILIYQNIKHQIHSLDDTQIAQLEEYIDCLLANKFRVPTFEDLNDLTIAMNNSIGETSVEKRIEGLKELGFDIVRINQ